MPAPHDINDDEFSFRDVKAGLGSSPAGPEVPPPLPSGGGAAAAPVPLPPRPFAPQPRVVVATSAGQSPDAAAGAAANGPAEGTSPSPPSAPNGGAPAGGAVPGTPPKGAPSQGTAPPAPLPQLGARAPGRQQGSSSDPTMLDLDALPNLRNAVRPGGEQEADGPDATRRREASRAARASRGRHDPRQLVQQWLREMVDNKASDLILRSSGRPSLRVDGKIRFLPGDVPGPGPMIEVLQGILGPERMARWHENGSADAAIQLDGLGRFRINAYKQMGEPAIVIRRISESAPTLDDLHLPAKELKELAMKKRGLVLVTGVAGSGKSTTLSAMIEYMNRNVERHVVTLEDPVELLFKERCCVISQREVGTDTNSFKDGLKHALRQSPDVILIGEVRDAETVVAALEAVETGHLVMSTMHTVNSSQTVDRILGFFPAERHVQIRQRMAQNLAGVLSMRLVPRVGGGMLPAYELLQSTPQVRELLEQGQTTELGRVVTLGSEPGLISFNERLLELIREGLVALEDALAASDRPDELLLSMRGFRGSSDRTVNAQPRAPQGPPGAHGSHGSKEPGAQGVGPKSHHPGPPHGGHPSAGPDGQQRRRGDPSQGGLDGHRANRDDGSGGLRLRGGDPAA